MRLLGCRKPRQTAEEEADGKLIHLEGRTNSNVVVLASGEGTSQKSQTSFFFRAGIDISANGPVNGSNRI